MMTAPKPKKNKKTFPDSGKQAEGGRFDMFVNPSPSRIKNLVFWVFIWSSHFVKLISRVEEWLHNYYIECSLGLKPGLIVLLQSGGGLPPHFFKARQNIRATFPEGSKQVYSYEAVLKTEDLKGIKIYKSHGKEA